MTADCYDAAIADLDGGEETGMLSAVRPADVDSGATSLHRTQPAKCCLTIAILIGVRIRAVSLGPLELNR